MKDRYIILTGSKNNAGDYLIKYRAKQLFAQVRPDREIIDLDAWKPLSNEQLEQINDSRALILTGGPALQKDMGSRIYPLVPDISTIKVPIIMMGVGYKGRKGTWEETTTYDLDARSLELLSVIENSGYQSSVRDYHTLNTLLHKGFNSFIMTGCPALYDTSFSQKEVSTISNIKFIGFSLGVSYLVSDSMNQQMKELMLALRDEFQDATITVYFHHKIDLTVPRQVEMVDWIKNNKMAFEDISGTADKLMEVYSKCDFHIGYRVHAHIFSSSISKPSILIAEDGRGIALKEVLKGLIYRGYGVKHASLFDKVMVKIGFQDKFNGFPIGKDVVANIKHEIDEHLPRLSATRPAISHLFPIMEKFLLQLP